MVELESSEVEKRVKGEVFRIFLIISLIISIVAMAGLGEASPKPVVSVDPKRVEDIRRDMTFTVDITVAGVTEEESLNGWEFGISFNSSILNATSLEEGPFLQDVGFTWFTPYINNEEYPENTTGLVGAMCRILGAPATGAYGSGILADITFQVIAEGKTTLRFYRTVNSHWDGTASVPVDHTSDDGFFTNLHDIAITSVTANTTEVNLGDSVSIDVTVVNKGDFTETFNVTTYWKNPLEQQEIDTKPVENLENGTPTSLTFTWDTTGVSTGTYNISAEASVVPGETKTDNNIKYFKDTVAVISVTAPVADFTVSSVTPLLDEEVIFNASASYDPDGGNITNYTWNFGDETPVVLETDPITTHTYTEPGNYFVVLKVTDDEGEETISESQLIKVMGYPVAFFTYSPESPLKNQPVTFNASLSDPKGGNIMNYTWNFDDGDVSTVTDPIIKHTYTEVRTYNVNLTVTDSEGLSNSTTQSVEVMSKRDVAVVSVSVPTEYVTIWAGISLKLNVVLKNHGTSEETFNVTLYYDDTAILPLEEITLAPFDVYTWTTPKWNAPLSEGDYTIKAKALLDDDDPTNNEANTTISVKLRNVAITKITVSSTTVLAGDILNVTVTVKNEGTATETRTINVIKAYAENATGSFEICESKSISSLKPGASKAVSFLWNATKEGFSPGNYTIWTEIEPLYREYKEDDNTAIYGNVTIGASVISISASKITLTVGKSTAINGSITPVRPNVNVIIQYRLAGEETWDIIETVTTDENSTYLYDWTPEETGTYEVIASWEGDEKTLPSESEILTIKVEEAPSNIVLYAAAVMAIIIMAATVATYFLKIRKTKPT